MEKREGRKTHHPRLNDPGHISRGIGPDFRQNWFFYWDNKPNIS